MKLGQAHRIVVSRRGGPDVLQWVPGDLVEPGPGQVRVRVEAAGVSAYDVMLRGHWFPGFPRLPYTPGEDFVGLVDKVGQGVDSLQPGQRVGSWTFGDAGAYAEFLCRPVAELVPVPDGLDPVVAAAMITNYLTAALALHHAIAVKEGERLLVQGAGGGLGSALLQLGRAAGLKTFGCDADEKHNQIRADGAEPIDYRSEDCVARTKELTGGGADVVIDLVGGAGQLLRSWRALDAHGRLLMLGMTGALQSGTAIIAPSLILVGLFAVWPGGRRLAKGPGMDTYPRAHPEWYRETLATLFDHALTGRLVPRLAEMIPMRDAAQAHQRLELGDVSGKLVLVSNSKRPDVGLR